MYTLKYFKHSTSPFLQQDPFYNMMSDSMKIKIVKNNLLLGFQEKFDILFCEPEFSF